MTLREKVHGNLEGLMTTLPIEMRDKAAKSAARAAAGVVRNEARRRVPNRTGSLKRSMSVVVRDYGELTVAYAGPRYLREGGPNAGNHGHLVEFGHKIKGTQKRVPPRPFLRPAADSTKKQQERAAVGKLWDTMLKAGAER